MKRKFIKYKNQSIGFNKFLSGFVSALVVFVGFVAFAQTDIVQNKWNAIWHGTDWIDHGSVIDAQKVAENFEYLNKNKVENPDNCAPGQVVVKDVDGFSCASIPTCLPGESLQWESGQYVCKQSETGKSCIVRYNNRIKNVSNGEIYWVAAGDFTALNNAIGDKITYNPNNLNIVRYLSLFSNVAHAWGTPPPATYDIKLGFKCVNGFMVFDSIRSTARLDPGPYPYEVW